MLSPNVSRHVIALSGVAANTLIRWQRDPLSVREASRLRIERALAQLGLTGTATPGPTVGAPLMISGACAGTTLADIGALGIGSSR